jgi:hypothetical protein
MQIYSQFLVSLFCLVAVSTAYSDDVNCHCGCQPGDYKVYQFNSRSPFTHEQFHCDIAANAPDALKVRLYNDAEMVKGFNADGKLKIKDKKLAKVYFDAYHDWRRPLCKGSVCTNNPAVSCTPGAEGRELIDGDYGAHA